ncbi:MAG: hypothetical protein ACR2J8_07815, partial [Thermomicrobiales bacterium]
MTERESGVARVHRVRMSHVELDPRYGVLRNALTPEHLRGPAFGNRFDATTLLYDLFRSADGQRVIGVGPPFRGGIDVVNDLQVRLTEAGEPLPFRVEPVAPPDRPRLPGRVVIDVPPQVSEVFLRLGLQEWRVPIQPNLGEAFAGTLALMTLSCDNDLDWIEDWARFHAVNYGVDAVVLYDNASVAYGPSEIEDRLRTVPGLREIVVIDQPARFGVRQQDLTGRYNAYP